jgi:hypothetical protein
VFQVKVNTKQTIVNSISASPPPNNRSYLITKVEIREKTMPPLLINKGQKKANLRDILDTASSKVIRLLKKRRKMDGHKHEPTSPLLSADK